MDLLLKRFFHMNIYVKIIFFFCVFGTFVNFFYVLGDLRSGGILLRLHLGFLLLYAGQVAFILLEERFVFILSVLQGILAFLTNADFTFVPLLRFLGHIYYAVYPNMSLEAMSVYKYVFISLAFTLEMLKSYILFALIVPPVRKSAKTEDSCRV